MAVKEQDKPVQKTAIIAPSVGTKQPNAIERSREFLGDVRGELRKVTSPTRAEVQSTTTVVILAVFAFAAFFYVVDSVLGYLLQALLHSLGGA